MFEVTIIFAAARGNSNTVLRGATGICKVGTDAIALKVKQEFAVKAKTKLQIRVTPTRQPKP